MPFNIVLGESNYLLSGLWMFRYLILFCCSYLYPCELSVACIYVHSYIVKYKYVSLTFVFSSFQNYVHPSGNATSRLCQIILYRCFNISTRYKIFCIIYVITIRLLSATTYNKQQHAVNHLTPYPSKILPKQNLTFFFWKTFQTEARDKKPVKLHEH